MNSFIDYAFYHDKFGGTLVPQSNFDGLALQASYKVNMLCYGRAEDNKQFEEEIKLATCSLLDTMFKINEDGGIKQSETTGKHSVTYSTSQQNSSERKEYYKSVMPYLANTGLLYSGVY